MALYRINIPASLFIGAGAVERVSPQAARLGMKRVLIVSDPAMVQSGRPGQVVDLLNAAGLEAVVYGHVQPDPTDQNVHEGLHMLREHRCDGLVAIGGGSSIDAAKGIAVMATNTGDLPDYMGYDKIPRAGLPLIAIPTTAGTGSEVTKVAIITDTQRDVKMMMLDPHLLPTAALVDYTLTFTMPKPLTAHVGVDTLTHAIEAYVSRKANPMTDVIALSAVRLVGQHLRAAWEQPDNAPAREGMMLAATQGGMAFSNSSVCLVHGMSRPIGALFHLPHGLSNAVLLPAVTRFSLSGAPERYAKVARTLGVAGETESVAAAGRKLIDALERLNADLGIPRLSACNIPHDRFEAALENMTADAFASGSPQNNPRVPTPEEMMALYREAY
ncbi:MAG: iron-containing alcohol dehydrogenase [Candidatus Latescibacteria bacterium]|nr:iron-containing alcohol dehydrogenase [Candidatus Latescibacterota bacterium]